MKTIIVEDNPSAANVLASYLSEYSQSLEIVGIADSYNAASRMIMEMTPELWLLDIQLGDQLVFELLNEIETTVVESASIIFITAYYEVDYLHKALKYSAVEYITKPIEKDKLFRALDDAIRKHNDSDIVSRIARLEDGMHTIQRHTVKSRIPIHRVNGNIDYISTDDLYYIETVDQVSRIHSATDTVATTKPLKFYNELLSGDPSFFRVSKQAIVNLDSVISYNHQMKEVQVKNGDTVTVSRRQAVKLSGRLSG